MEIGKLRQIDEYTNGEPMLGIDLDDGNLRYICEVYNLGNDVNQPTDAEAKEYAERIIKGWNCLKVFDELLAACKYAFENLSPKGDIRKDFSGHNAKATLSKAIYNAKLLAPAEQPDTAPDEAPPAPYPSYCFGCDRHGDCTQKTFMLPNTKPVYGYINIHQSDYSCWGCAGSSSARLPSDRELDQPAHCVTCGRPLMCKLTPEGVAYVREHIGQGIGCCRELWPVLFKDYLEGSI